MKTTDTLLQQYIDSRRGGIDRGTLADDLFRMLREWRERDKYYRQAIAALIVNLAAPLETETVRVGGQDVAAPNWDQCDVFDWPEFVPAKLRAVWPTLTSDAQVVLAGLYNKQAGEARRRAWEQGR